MILERDIMDSAKIIRHAFCSILGFDVNTDRVRYSYQIEGAPSWDINETVLFLFVDEIEDAYGKQRDSIFESRDDTVIKISARTRVLSVNCVCYGPNASKWLNKLKDGLFHIKTKRILGPEGISYVPLMPAIIRIPELYNAMWWTRYDVKFTFNDLYVTEEDVGRIDEATVVSVTEKGG